MTGLPCLLTEAEVADRLKCSVSKVRKLRYAGLIAFLPGRPVLILESDFVVLQRQQQELAYARWAGRKVRRRATRPPDPPSITERTSGLSPEARGRLKALQLASFAATKARRQRGGA
ncbi:helix-turn-helix domain-containing protein [Methylobacterium sp. J-059]|uniref:helix-turn-helix domain-containing protein n=1 Tax=Methylobacterium sp. J-059 TaxID=2836643 RepID=UPI001FB86FC1|nr:helix-turn-helix domain-containing protein [Methylobacterium sp. J-059]MCJ2040285.1 helix-turn-helix domain-containing protein [Methylobacterium sp. J-059]